MADVSVQMGVSGVSQFKSQMSQAQASVKSIDAALRLNEKQYKATGDAEAYMQNKTTQLNSKLQAQQNAVKAAEGALKAMKDSGVDPLSEAYQKMEAQMLNAQSAVLDTQQQINELGTETAETAGKTNELSNSLQGLNKKVSLDQVINGIGKITSGMEAAAKKAVELGKSIWDNIMDSAEYADDISTLATKMGLTTDELQRMIYVADRFEAPAEQMAKTWKKVKMSMTSDSKEVQESLEKLGLAGTKMVDTGFGQIEERWQKAGNYKDMFWEIGDALMRYGDEEDKERIAQTLLGRSWEEMIPLFKAGREAYEEAMEAAPVATEEAVEQAASLNDRMKELETQWQTMKLEVIGAIAPALEKAADALGNLLGRINDYLKSDVGQEKLKAMEEAVSALFDDLANIDPDSVVDNFAKVFNGIVESFKWIKDHWQDVKNGLKGIAIGFGALKLAQIGLNIANLVSGISGLAAGAGASAATSAATSTATAAAAGAGTSLLTKVLSKGWSALKFLGPVGAFVGTLLTPAETDAGEAIDYENSPQVQENNRKWEYISKIREQLGEGKFQKITHQNTLQDSTGSNLVDDHAYEIIDEMYEKGKAVEETAQALKEYGIENGSILKTVSDLTEEEKNSIEERKGSYGWTYTPSEPMEEENYKLTDELSQAIEEYYDLLKMPQTSDVVESLVDQYDKLSELLGGDEGMVDAIQERLKEIISEGDMLDDLPDDWYAELPLEPELTEDAAGSIRGQLSALGVFTVPVKPAMIGGMADGFAANGLWSVPFDGYRAVLHKGERVVPAREVGSSRNYSSNLYVESMYMNNGTDAEGLAAAMAAAQRRTMSGYGS